MSFLKAIGKFFAGLFVLLGVAIFIITSFGCYAEDNINILEEGFTEGLNKALQESEIDCNQNPNDKNCQLLTNNTVLNNIKKEVGEFEYYGGMMKIFGIILFIIGLMLFIWCNGLLFGLRATFLISFIGIVFSYLYYRYVITNILTTFLPKEVIDIVGNWITISLNQTLNLILILGVTFLILTIGLYILKYRQKKND